MIPFKIFLDNLQKVTYRPDQRQMDVITPGPDVSLFVVAGPGSGKTAVLTTRVLKLVFVDGVDPASILATTFTKKAAGELRSRILGTGFELQSLLLKRRGLGSSQKKWLESVDINQVLTGTIDSICEQVLRDYRKPGTLPPLLVDDFIYSTVLLREGLFKQGRFNNQELYDLIGRIRGSTWGINIGTKVEFLKEILARRHNDLVDWPNFINSFSSSREKAAWKLVYDALEDYCSAMDKRGMMDFTLLEQQVLDRLKQGQLKDFTDGLKVIMVDEYQDTNLLQESIYFEMVKASGGSLLVVGDDDQSLFRFRGATVELFVDFPQRLYDNTSKKSQKVFLTTNYRSTKRIISLVNNYAGMDASFQEVRAKKKPAIQPGPAAQGGLPILGMFRQTLDELSEDLSGFIHAVFRDNGFKLPGGEVIIKDPDGGDLGDCALLCGSPMEKKYDGTARLPGLLRQNLSQKDPPVEVFNPRGQELVAIPLIQEFGGLILYCLDPRKTIQGSLKGLGSQVIGTLDRWRNVATGKLNQKGYPGGLTDYCQGWARRDPGRKGYRWPGDVHVLDLLYGLRYWFDDLQKDPEGQVYLEVFTRQVSSCETIGKFGARVVYNPQEVGLSEASVRELYRNVLIPIASGTIKVNEELIDTFPRDCLNILSIHQAKGLEFPLVMVDVGTDYKRNHTAHAFKRFPDKGGSNHNLEDDMRPFSPLGRPSRIGKDRAFDDLYRQYFVAYSRPEKILLLVGTKNCLPGSGIYTVTTGRDRRGKNCWDANTLLLI